VLEGDVMDRIIKKMEGVLKSIRESELLNNPKASAKALEIKKMIEDLKNTKTKNSTDQGVLSYINAKVLLEN
jgi:hypothetical protein